MSGTSAVVERPRVEGHTVPKISVVVPVNGPDTDVRNLVLAYTRELDKLPHSYEFVFVLDGVAGAVLATLEQMQRDNAPIKIVTLQGGGLGESIAMTAGAQKAAGEYIITVPQYLQIEPSEIHKLVDALEAGYDFVTPWRSPRVDAWLNRAQSALFNWVLRHLCRMQFHDLNCAFRGMRRQVLEEVNVYGDLYRFLPVMAHRQGFRVKEVKVRHREEAGKSGFFGVGVYLRRLLDILAVTFLTRFTRKPLRFFGTVGIVLMLIGIVFAAQPLWERFAQGGQGVTERPLFLVAVMLISFGVQFIGFGLVGEIIIFTQAHHVQDYRIDRFYDSVGEIATEVTSWLPTRTALVVRPLGPGEADRWERLVAEHPDATFFHTMGWQRVVERVFGHAPYHLIAEDAGTVRGVLPLFLVRSMFLGRTLISTPYGVYGGILAADRDTELALLRQAVALAERERVKYLELRNVGDRRLGLPTSDLYGTYVKALPDKPEDCLEIIPRKARAEARKGRDRGGLTFHAGCSLDEFYELFSLNKRSLGSPALPRQMFQAIADEFHDRMVIHRVCTRDGRTAAAVMSFRWRDTLMAYYSGARDEFEDVGLNNFMYWKLTEWAVQNGIRKFDFGRSRVGTGPASFKKNMGYEMTPLHYQYHLVGRSRLPEFHPGNPRLSLPKQIWRKLPSTVANPLGSWLSRYLP